MPVSSSPITPHRVIRASAGSGKTFQLTGHYIRLLRAGHEPSRILATTFTRKAAGEILGTILTRLVEACRDSDQRQALAYHTGGGSLSEGDCRALLRQLVQAMHRLAISTIDGFFYRIASGFRFELDLPFNPRLLDSGSPAARALRSEAISAMLADSDLNELLYLLRRLHHDTTARSVTSALDQIVQNLHETYRQAPHREQWDQLSPPTPLDESALASALVDLEAAQDALPVTKQGKPNQSFAKALAKNLNAARLRDWETFLANGLAPKLAAGETDFSSQPIPQPLAEAYSPLIEHARAQLLEQVRQKNLARYDLLRRFDAHYQALRRQHNVMLFSDLTDALARGMPHLEPGQLADIYFRLDSTVTHLLLDEFQDTSLDQWAVLQPFAEEIAAHGEPDLAEGARSFFCVGDTKQAIYGWRGGCSALLDQLDEQLQLPETAFESLNQSFRSSPPVLKAVNAVFETIDQNTVLTAGTTHEADGEAARAFAARFTAHEPAPHLASAPGRVQLETSPYPASGTTEPTQGDEAVEDDEAEGNEAPLTYHEAHVAERVCDIHRASPEATIGVLVSTNKMAGRLIHELRQRSINGKPLPVSGEGGAPLTDCPAVNVILSAMTLADHPGPDRGCSAAAFHVANSPLGKVIGLNTTQPREVQRASQTIRSALLAEGYANLVSRWIAALAPYCDAHNLARLEQLIALAEAYEPEQTLRPGRFVQQVENTPVEQAQPAPIRVMTVHRSKGLQFDTVVLAELDRTLGDDFELLVQREGEVGEVQAVHPCPNKQVRELSDVLTQAHHERRRQRRYEDLCGLYVALTRAKRQLYMMIRPPAYTPKGALSKPRLSLAEILRESLSSVARDQERGNETLFAARQDAAGADQRKPSAPEVATSDSETDAEGATEPARFDGAAVSPSPLRVSLAPPSAQPRRAWLTVSPSSVGQSETVSPAELLTLGGGEARQRGLVIHRWFEQVGFVDDPDGWPNRDRLVRAAREVMPEIDEQTLNAWLEAFEAMLQAPAIHSAMSRPGSEDVLWREHSFAVRDRGRLLQGRFDRVVLHRRRHKDEASPTANTTEAGQPLASPVDAATLMDFKTDRVPDEQTLQAATERYTSQLKAYRRALSSMLRLDEKAITPTLVFVEPGRCVQI